MPNGVTLNVSTQIKEHLVQETLPSLHFDYDDVRVMMESSGSACFFVSNDQYELSDKFAQHISQYNKEQIYVNQEILKLSKELDIPYLAFNFPIDSCLDCGYQGEFNAECPECGSTNIQQLRRVTGYLTTDYRNFNKGKQSEVEHRIKHSKFS